MGLLKPESSWSLSLSVTLDNLSNYPQERSLAHANSEEEATLVGPLVDRVSAGGSCFYQNLSAQNSSLGPHPPLQMWSPNPVAPTASFFMPGPAATAFLHPGNWISAQEVLQTATLLFRFQAPLHTKILPNDALTLHSTPLSSVLMQPPRPKEIIALIITGQLGRVSVKNIVRAAPEEKPRSWVQAHTKSLLASWP